VKIEAIQEQEDLCTKQETILRKNRNKNDKHRERASCLAILHENLLYHNSVSGPVIVCIDRGIYRIYPNHIESDSNHAEFSDVTVAITMRQVSFRDGLRHFFVLLYH
jgi:hypothetical protein